MKRKAAALLAAVFLLLETVCVPSLAVENVYFTAINDNVMPMNDETMPFWSGGFLYIPISIFSGEVYRELEIGYIPNAGRQLYILYTAGKSLHFDLTTAYARDTDGNTYYPGAVQKSGVVFVPTSLVAEFFGLTYSTTGLTGANAVTQEDRGWLVWLRQPDNILQVSVFADAAKSQLRARYEQYLKSREESGVQVPDTPQQPEETFEGKSIYLCFLAGDAASLGGLLDALDRYSAQAAFFCTPEFSEQQGDLLRRMAATGQAIGLLANGEAEQSVQEQLERGNRALYEATCGKTRLVYLQNVDAQTAAGVEQAGYCVAAPDMDRAAYGLTSGGAQALLQRITARRGDVSCWLGQNVSAGGLRAFLTAAETAEDRCLALTETTARK